MRMLSAVFLALLFSSGGCSSNSQPTDAVNTTAESDQPGPRSSPSVRKIELSTLPEVQSHSPPLDGGRIAAPLLKDWSVPPRSKEWLFRWRKDTKSAYPVIFLSRMGNPPLETDQLTKTSAAQFAEKWQDILAAEHDSKSLAASPSVVRLGKRYAVECQLYASTEKLKLDRQLLAICEQQHVYLLELRAIRGTLAPYQPALYAIAAGIQVLLPEKVGSDIAPAAQTLDSAAVPPDGVAP